MNTVPFTDLLSAIVDNRGRTCPTAESGIPLIATNCVKNDGLYPTYDTVRRVDDATYATWFRGHPEPGDVLFVCKGAPGSVAMVPAPVDFCIAQDMVAVRPDPERVYPRYLFAALRSPQVQSQIASMHVGTLIPHFKKGDFGQLQIPLPDRTAQMFIGDLYMELSEKIESNRRLAEVVDHLVRAEVKAASSDGTTGVVADLVTNIRSTVRPGVTDRDTRYVGLEHMPRGSIVLNSWGSSKGLGSAKATFSDGDILFGKLRPYFKKVGLALPTGGICSTDILVLRPTERSHTAVALAVLASDDFIEFASNAASGTRMPRASWDHMKTFPITIPSRGNLGRLADLLDPLLASAQRGVEESMVLAELRDTLLPGLLSGRLRVPVAEHLVESAT